MAQRAIRPLLIGTAIVAVGIAGFLILVVLRPEPPKAERTELAPLVRVANARLASGTITVDGTGTVAALRETRLAAEVPGRVTWVSPSFVTGGSFDSGDAMLRVDSTDYALAVRTAEADVTQARYNLLVAREESEVARSEWASLQERTDSVGTTSDSELGSLVLREPQVALAAAGLRAAEARLADARLRLERTTIRAPFNGRVRTRAAELGQVLAPGAPVASFYSTDAAEIVVALPLSDAELIEGLFDGPDRRIAATVRRTVGSRTASWSGLVNRVEGALDPATRTARVVIRVPDPYETAGGNPPLLLGSFVSVEIEARTLDSYVDLPVDALRENQDAIGAEADHGLAGDVVWVVRDGRLRVEPVDVLKRLEDRAVITAGLSGGEQVVVSALEVVTDSMAVRVDS